MKRWTVYVQGTARYGYEPREVEVTVERNKSDRDEDGQIAYSNTHFPTRDEAWRAILTHYSIGVKWAGQEIVNAESALARAREKAGEAARDFAIVSERHEESVRESRRSSP